MTSVLKEIEVLVSKNPEDRKLTDIMNVLIWFKRRSDVFHSLKTDAVADIIRNCELVQRPKDTLILRQGDKGDCFFIILSGQVSIYVGMKDDDENNDEDGQTTIQLNTRNIQNTGGLSSTIQDVNSLPKLSDPVRKPSRRNTPTIEAFRLPTFIRSNQPMDKTKFGQLVATIADGKSFGELALIRKDCVRNATIITDTSIQLLVVNRELYNRCIKDSQEKEFREKQQFVDTSEYFSNWSNKNKRHLAMSLRRVTYTYGSPIICQGQPVNHIYFLVSGLCRVIIDPTLHQAYNDVYPTKDTEEAIKGMERDYTEYIPLRTTACRKKNIKHGVRGYDICLIGRNNMIGDVELAANLTTYLQSAVCEQQMDAYVLDIRNYERLILKRNPHTVSLLVQNSLLKLNNRALRFKQIPLLSSIYEKLTAVSGTPVKKPYTDDYRVLPVPDYGPLVDIFGPGTVFHYIRTRERQLKKARLASRALVIHKRISQTAQPTQATKNDTLSDKSTENKQALKHPTNSAEVSSGCEPTDDTPHPTTLDRLQMFELQRMNRLEERILAWHVEVEAAKINHHRGSISGEGEMLHGYLSVPHFRVQSATITLRSPGIVP